MRLAAGAVEEDVTVACAGDVSVRYERSGDGWSAEFTVRTPAVPDLAVVHRLVAPSLGEARRLVPAAVAFLSGEPVDPAAPTGR
jgi:hypothetical protein